MDLTLAQLLYIIEQLLQNDYKEPNHFFPYRQKDSFL